MMRQPSAPKPPRQNATLFFVEHGLTEGDGTPDEIIHGWGNQGITDEGRAAVQKTAAWLKAHGATDVYTSDLRRSEETANIIADAINLKHPPEGRVNLRPMDVGTLRGMKKTDVEGVMDDLLTRKWAKAPGGESYADFLSRFGSGLRQAIDESLQAGPGICVYVTHSHNLGAIPHLLSEEAQDYTTDSPVGNAGVLEMKVEKGGKRISIRKAFEPNGKDGS